MALRAHRGTEEKSGMERERKLRRLRSRKEFKNGRLVLAMWKFCGGGAHGQRRFLMSMGCFHLPAFCFCVFILENEYKKYELVKKNYCLKDSTTGNRSLTPKLCMSVLY